MLWKRLRHRKEVQEDDLIHHLLYATISRDIRRVEELIECGIDPCSQMEDGTSPIHKAAVMESPYGPLIIASMLRYGADPNVTTPTGLVPLHIAAMWGRVETINILLDNGADVFMKDEDDKSALDYADEAEENRYECIDALTRYRATPCRRRSVSKTGCFLSKSRLNLDKILGGDISFSDNSVKEVQSEKAIRTDRISIEQETLFMRHHGRRKRKSLRTKLRFNKSSHANVAVQTDTPKNKQIDETHTNTIKNKKNKKQTESTNELVNSKLIEKQTLAVEKLKEVLDIDVPDGIPDRTVYESCEEDTIHSFSRDDSKCIISSTFVEEPTIYDSALSVQEMSVVNEEVKKGSSGSSSSSSKSSSSDVSCTGALRQSTPVKPTVSNPPSNQVETIAIVHMPHKKAESGERTETSSKRRGRLDSHFGRIPSGSSRKCSGGEEAVWPLRESESSLYIPVSVPTTRTTNCNLNIKICISDAHSNKLYKKHIDSLQISSRTEHTKNKERIRKEKKPVHHYHEIPPLSTKRSESTFESAREYMDDEVKYEEISLIRNEVPLETVPNHLGDELESKVSCPTTQNVNSSEAAVDQIGDELSRNDMFHPSHQNEKYARDDMTDEGVCIDIIPSPVHSEEFLEAIPDHIGNELVPMKILSPQSDDSLESRPSESFINLDAHELTTYGDNTFEATIELNQPTIDYISTNVNSNALSTEPTLDYISNNPTYDVPPSASDMHYANMNENNNAPVSELVHYFEVKSAEGTPVCRQLEKAGEKEDINVPQVVKENAEENAVTRQIQKINFAEETLATRLFEATIVSPHMERRNNEEDLTVCHFENGNKEDSVNNPQFPEKGIEGDRVKKTVEERVFEMKVITDQCEEGLTMEDIFRDEYDMDNVEDDKCDPRGRNEKDKDNTVRQHLEESCADATGSSNEDKTSMYDTTTRHLRQINGEEPIVTEKHARPNFHIIKTSNECELKSTTPLSSILYVSGDVTNEELISARNSVVNRSDDICSSEIYEESGEENETMISARDCIYSCGDDDESSNSSALDETDDVNTMKVPMVEIFQKPCGLLVEYSDVCVNYGWKDVCGFSRELEDTMVKVPSRIITLHDGELKTRLKRIGVTAKNITDKTRKIYQRHLVKVEMCNQLALKPSEMYEDYTSEMAQVLCGNMEVSEESGKLLEAEMMMQFTNPEKFTWREGTQNTSFSYLLLDPRVTNNLPGRTENMTYLGTLKVFIASIFCVGRGRKCRPYEHLEEAARYISRARDEPNSDLAALEAMASGEKIDQPQNKKMSMIHDIWGAGLGVVSLHVFKNVIPVEAFTREACMIEAMGLPRLTNTKYGDLYGSASSWDTKKLRLLGIYTLMKAMETFLSEGEYQIRMKDLESSDVRSPKSSCKDDSMRTSIVRASFMPSARFSLQPPRLSLNGASLREPFFCSK